MRIGFSELIVIAIVVLALVKPSTLAMLAQNLGKVFGVIRDNKDDIMSEISDTTKDIADIVKPVTDIRKEVSQSIQDVKDGVVGSKEDE